MVTHAEIIQQILDLSGPVPSAEGYRRALKTRPTAALLERLHALQAEKDKPYDYGRRINLRGTLTTR